MATVLLVEDDHVVRGALQRSLSDLGHTVYAAGTALEALRRVAAETPDLIVLDLGLPDLDGAEALRLLPAAAALVEQSWLSGVADSRIDLAVDLLPRYTTTKALEWSVGDLAVWLHRVGLPVPEGISLAEPHRRHLAGDAAGAAEIWAGVGEPYAQALALVDTGVDAEAFRALEILDRLGATAVAARVRRDLRDRGLLRVPAGPRPSTRANPAGLTGRQLEILVMLAEGLTNAQLADRLYISPKTVDHHVSAILSKLAADSRTEAVHIARTSGII